MNIMEVHVLITVLLEIVVGYVPKDGALTIVVADVIICVGHCRLTMVVVVKKKKTPPYNREELIFQAT